MGGTVLVPLEVETYRGVKKLKSKKEKSMRGFCFQKVNSKEPICGAHNAVLVQKRLPIDPNAPGLGQITCYICAVTRVVVDVSAGTQTAGQDRKGPYARTFI
jgi:hypothetical protein